MEEAKSSVDEHLSQIDAKLASHAAAGSFEDDNVPAEVLSAEGVHSAKVDSVPDVHEVHETSAPQVLVEAPESDLPAPLPMPDANWAEPQLVEAVSEALTAEPEAPSMVAQVLGGFSDTWVTETTHRLDDLKEQITVVHHKLDQFSHR